MKAGVDVEAAGGLLRRDAAGGPEFCIVHRPRYDDWTIPKGKLEPGETHEEAAAREIAEETGFAATLGLELPSTTYLDHEARSKSVRYWLMEPGEGGFVPNDEVDELRWLGGPEAAALLTHDHDRQVISAALGADAPVFLVRHAKAGSRTEWAEDDRLRPLSKTGRKQAEAIAKALTRVGVVRIVSSPYIRCVQTVRPLALRTDVPVETLESLAEGSSISDAWMWLLSRTGTTVACSHGDVIPALLDLAENAGASLPKNRECRKGSIWKLERRAGRPFRASYDLPG